MIRKREDESGSEVKSPIYVFDEKQTAIRAAQTRVSSPGIGSQSEFFFSVKNVGQNRKPGKNGSYLYSVEGNTA